MRVTALYPFEYDAKSARLHEYFALRRRVFKDRLDWDVTTQGDYEIDGYDALRPIYLTAHDDEDRIVGGVRFLSCDDATMVQNTFGELLQGHDIPPNEEIYESSRFCIDTVRAREIHENGLRLMTHVLFAGMIEWALGFGASRIVTVTDTRLERIAARAGWAVERIGDPRRIGKTDAVAGYLEVSEAAALRVRERAGLVDPVYDDEEIDRVVH